MSDWAKVDDWRRNHEPRPRIRNVHVEREKGSPLEPVGPPELVADKSSVVHVRTCDTPYRYHGKDGAVREWRRDQLGHAVRHEAIYFVALCSEVNGELPLYHPKDARRVLNRLTGNIHRVTCEACRVLLDREMESGRVMMDGKGVLQRKGEQPPTPLENTGREETLARMVDCPACPSCGAGAGSTRGEAMRQHELRCMACGFDWWASTADLRQARAADVAHERALRMRWI